MRWIFRGLLAAVMLAALMGTYVFYPYWTLTRINDAMRSGDLATLETFIDWGSVRAGVRSDLAAIVQDRVRKDASVDSFAAKAALTRGAAVDRMVDGSVTANGLVALMKTSPTKEMSDLVAQVWFTSPTTFIVGLRPEEDGTAVNVVMQMSGLTWRVTRLLVDIAALEALPATKSTEQRIIDALSKPKL